MSSEPSAARVRIERRGRTRVIHFTRRRVVLDDASVLRAGEELFGQLGEPGADPVLLDLGNVAYLTSTGLDLVIRLHQRVKAAGGRLTVGDVTPRVYEVFAVTRLDRLLDLRCREDENDLPAAG